MKGQTGIEYLIMIGGVLLVALIVGAYMTTAASKIYNEVTGVSGATLKVNPVPNKLAYWVDNNTLGSASFLTVDTPSGTLNVGGTVRASKFCIGSSCVTSWSGSGVTDTRCDTQGTCSQLCIGMKCITSWNDVNYVSGGGGSASTPWHSSGSNIYYTGGNVGIGTNNPQYVLDVNGSMRVQKYSGGSGLVLEAMDSAWKPFITMLSASNPNAVSEIVGGNLVGDPFLGIRMSDDGGGSWHDAVKLTLFGGEQKIIINGKVGINTAPNYELDVNGSVTAKNLCMNGTCISDWSEVNTFTTNQALISIKCRFYQNDVSGPWEYWTGYGCTSAPSCPSGWTKVATGKVAMDYYHNSSYGGSSIVGYFETLCSTNAYRECISVKCPFRRYNSSGWSFDSQYGCTSAPSCPSGWTKVATGSAATGVYGSSTAGYFETWCCR